MDTDRYDITEDELHDTKQMLDRFEHEEPNTRRVKPLHLSRPDNWTSPLKKWWDDFIDSLGSNSNKS